MTDQPRDDVPGPYTVVPSASMRVPGEPFWSIMTRDGFMVAHSRGGPLDTAENTRPVMDRIAAGLNLLDAIRVLTGPTVRDWRYLAPVVSQHHVISVSLNIGPGFVIKTFVGDSFVESVIAAAAWVAHQTEPHSHVPYTGDAHAEPDTRS